MSQPPTPGQCRYCRCSETSPCSYCKGTFGGVNFYDRRGTVCSQPACISQFEIAKADAARANRPRKLNSADVHMLIRRRGRKARRRAA
jgi:hypothetical protein